MVQSLMHRRHCSPLVVFVLLLIDLRLSLVDSSFQVLPESNDGKSAEFNIKELIDVMKVLEDEEIVVRLPSNSLLKYTSYKDVSILHFDVPPDTRTAYFTFKAFEDSKSAFRK